MYSSMKVTAPFSMSDVYYTYSQSRMQMRKNLVISECSKHVTTYLMIIKKDAIDDYQRKRFHSTELSLNNVPILNATKRISLDGLNVTEYIKNLFKQDNFFHQY